MGAGPIVSSREVLNFTMAIRKRNGLNLLKIFNPDAAS